MRSYVLLFFIVSLISSPLPGWAQVNAERSFLELEASWTEWRASNTGLTVARAQEWIDRFWNFRQQHPNTQAASRAAVLALELTWQVKDLDALKEKYEAISIHEPAMIEAVGYVPSVVGRDVAVEEWRRIARDSDEPIVQAAALFEIAEYYRLNRRYAHLANLLDTLETRYGVTPQHERYGAKIEGMRENVRTLSIGNILPAFHATSVDGDFVSSSQLRGQVVLLYFYGSGCGSCISMYPVLNTLYEKYHGDDFYLLGISADRGFLTVEEFRAFLRRHDINWPQTLDVELFDQYGIAVLSTVLLVDKEGRLAWVGRGSEVLEAVTTLSGKGLANAIDLLLRS